MRLTLLGRPRLFLLTTFVFLPPQVVRKVLARLKYSVPLYKAGIGFSILTEECLTFQTVFFPPHFCFPPTFAFPTTFDLLTHLSFRLLLIRSHICFSDDFCFAPFIRRNFVPSGLPHSFSTNHSLSTNHSFSTNPRVPSIFVFQQSSLTDLSRSCSS